MDAPIVFDVPKQLPFALRFLHNSSQFRFMLIQSGNPPVMLQEIRHRPITEMISSLYQGLALFIDSRKMDLISIDGISKDLS